MIVAIVVAVVIVAAGFWYWQSKQTPEQAPSSPEAPTLGSEIFDKTQNPLGGQVPSTNPFKDQKNPLDTIYKNPFE